MTRIGRSVVLAMMALAIAMSAGCAKEPEPTQDAKIAPPAIKTAGVLLAGVDLSVPPFAGTDQGKQAGIDVDVASALAERLGVTVKLVDVKPSDAATALASGAADIVLSVPVASSDLSQLSLAGSYLADAPAFFAAVEGTESVEPSLSLSNVKARRIGVQTESEAYWLIRQQIDNEAAVPYASLREALAALSGGEVELVAGDAIIGAYISRDFPKVRYVGQLTGGTPLAVAVASENTALGDAVRGELDALAADGVLDTIRRKWVGDLPEIRVEPSVVTTTEP
jgi:polar amino acid transport system substrate-binding protein